MKDPVSYGKEYSWSPEHLSPISLLTYIFIHPWLANLLARLSFGCIILDTIQKWVF